MSFIATAAPFLLRHLQAPPLLTQPQLLEKMGGDILLPSNAQFPSCAFTQALSEKGRHEMPQAIAHRGFRARYPENSMAAFKGAVDVGSHAIETDIHLTKDDVVVLSHDATLSRCFGRSEKIVDCDWSFVSSLRTTAEPRQTMPRLADLLSYLAQPDLEDIWVLLDIKLDNDSEKVMRLIASTLASVPSTPAKPWTSRIVLGVWAAKYLPLARHYLPDYPITYIGFSTIYARQFFNTPDVSFNMLCPALQGPGGRKFLADCKDRDRQVYAWTVNTEDKMDWCIRRRIDGVITDDPEKFLRACDEFDESRPARRRSLGAVLDSLRIWLLVLVFASLVRSRLDRVKPPAKVGVRST